MYAYLCAYMCIHTDIHIHTCMSMYCSVYIRGAYAVHVPLEDPVNYACA